MLNIEFVILLGWGILILGFLRKDYTITALSSIYLMVIGTWILTFDTFTLPPLVKLGFGALHIGIGFYVLFRSGTETYKGKSFRKPKWLGLKKDKEVKNKEENGIQERRR